MHEDILSGSTLLTRRWHAKPRPHIPRPRPLNLAIRPNPRPNITGVYGARATRSTVRSTVTAFNKVNHLEVDFVASVYQAINVLHLLLKCSIAMQMAVLKAVLDDYGNDINTWLSGDQRSTLLNVLRDSFLCSGSDDFQQRKDILLVIELFAGSFQLTDAARQFYFVSQS